MASHQKHHQEQAAFTGNWKKKNVGKGKNKREKGKSDIVDSNLTPIFNPNLKTNKSNSNYFINIPKSSNYSQNIKFLLDTGASCHIVNELGFFYKYVDTTEETVKVGENKNQDKTSNAV